MNLAQINIAKMRAPLEDPIMKDFVDNLERINELADRSEGFVWRLQDESGDATSIQIFEPDVIVNMSVWKDIESLKNYVYKSEHVEIFMRRKEWFKDFSKAHMAFWYVEPEHIPTEDEGKKRLEYLWHHGPTPYAFNFGKPFTIEDAKTYQTFAS